MSEPIINTGILAHVDAGKTSITEQLLFHSGSIRQAGSVDSGTARTDWLDVERRRGISVRSAAASLVYNGTRINIIDTPGHVDFMGEVERCLSVLDCAVLVMSAVEGIQTQTRILWKALAELEIPVILVINKVDRAGSDVVRLLSDVRKEFSPQLLITQTVTDEASDACRVVLNGDAAYDRFAAAAECDDELAEAFMEEREVEEKRIAEALRRGISERKIFPVLFASAKKQEGIDSILDALTDLLPPSSGHDDEPLSAVVYQVRHHKTLGKVAHVRMFSGRIKNRDSIKLPGDGGEAKITQIRRIDGGREIDTGEARSGEIAAVYGLSSVRTGDVLGAPPPRKSCSITVPLLQVQAFPEKTEQLPDLVKALGELYQEDPLLDLEWNAETREIWLRVTGKIQLEVMTELIQERYDMKVAFSQPTVIYKETPLRAAEGFEAYTMPKPCWAVVHLVVEPLPLGSGIEFRSIIKGNVIPYRYQNHIKASIPRALKQGRKGWEVTDARFTLVGGEHHEMHTHPLDFFVATPVAVQKALRNSGSLLLEPYFRVTLSADESLLGGVIRDVLTMRGTFESPEIFNGQFILQTELPLATSMDYPVEFRSITSGRGTYAAEFIGYRECPPGEGEIAPRRGIDPLDRAKWILFARNAIQPS